MRTLWDIIASLVLTALSGVLLFFTIMVGVEPLPAAYMIAAAVVFVFIMSSVATVCSVFLAVNAWSQTCSSFRSPRSPD